MTVCNPHLNEFLAEGVQSLIVLKGDEDVVGGLGEGGGLKVDRQFEGGSYTLHLPLHTI
jgi:hypothetical protein